MSSIEAWAALAKSEPLEPFVYPAPEFPPPGEVSVRVTHCGVCHSDVHQIDDDWKIATFPLVPGEAISQHATYQSKLTRNTMCIVSLSLSYIEQFGFYQASVSLKEKDAGGFIPV